MDTVMLKDASNANNANNANNGYVATGKIERSKAVVRDVCTRTTCTMLTTAVKRMSSVITYLFTGFRSSVCALDGLTPQNGESHEHC